MNLKRSNGYLSSKKKSVRCAILWKSKRWAWGHKMTNYKAILFKELETLRLKWKNNIEVENEKQRKRLNDRYNWKSSTEQTHKTKLRKKVQWLAWNFGNTPWNRFQISIFSSVFSKKQSIPRFFYDSACRHFNDLK